MRIIITGTRFASLQQIAFALPRSKKSTRCFGSWQKVFSAEGVESPYFSLRASALSAVLRTIPEENIKASSLMFCIFLINHSCYKMNKTPPLAGFYHIDFSLI
ncbi:MAG: hypothetical protein ACT6FD_03710 [Methanosarcinaceae archaeon]